MYSNPNYPSSSEFIDRTSEIAYAAHVYDPEMTEPARIPSSFPISTALTKSDRLDVLSTDANGNLLIRATFPDLLTTNLAGAVTYCNDGSWDPNFDDDPLLVLNGLGVSQLAYQADARYRPVAYKLKLRYIGSELNRAGIFFASHDFSFARTSNLLAAASLRQMQDCPVFELSNTRDGIEIVYKPYDNSYTEFSKINSNPSAQANTSWFAPYTVIAGITGAPASTAIVVEQFLTVEYIPSTGTSDIVELKSVQGDSSGPASLQSKDIIRPSETVSKEVDQGNSVWYKVAQKVSSGVGNFLLGAAEIGGKLIGAAAQTYMSKTPAGMAWQMAKNMN